MASNDPHPKGKKPGHMDEVTECTSGLFSVPYKEVAHKTADIRGVEPVVEMLHPHLIHDEYRESCETKCGEKECTTAPGLGFTRTG